MTKGAASKILTRLEAKGQAERRLAEDRAREQVLMRTPAGRRLVPSMADANEEHFFGHLKAAERKALMAQIQTPVAHHGRHPLPLGRGHASLARAVDLSIPILGGAPGL